MINPLTAMIALSATVDRAALRAGAKEVTATRPQ